MPKTKRYGLGVKIETLSLNFFELLIRANYARDFKRQEILDEASVILDLLKILLRLSKDSRAIPEKNYVRLGSELHETGQMLGGWIKSLKTNKPR